jgi:preprotein translocase subunit SecE
LVAKAKEAKARDAKQKKENRVIQYVRETWFELRKVSWPTRAEALNLTGIVVVVTTFLSVVLAVVDWLFQSGFGLILK